jgi:hypothetical protein
LLGSKRFELHFHKQAGLLVVVALGHPEWLVSEDAVGWVGFSLFSNKKRSAERGCCSHDLDLECSYPQPETPIGRVFVVQGCHFDVGFVLPSPTIINMWFHQFFPLAYEIGAALEKNTTSAARLKFTAESWLVQLFLFCPVEYEKEGI